MLHLQPHSLITGSGASLCPGNKDGVAYSSGCVLRTHRLRRDSDHSFIGKCGRGIKSVRRPGRPVRTCYAGCGCQETREAQDLVHACPWHVQGELQGHVPDANEWNALRWRQRLHQRRLRLPGGHTAVWPRMFFDQCVLLERYSAVGGASTKTHVSPWRAHPNPPPAAMADRCHNDHACQTPSGIAHGG